MPGGKLAPNLARRGVQERPDEVAWITYTTFNMKDPVVGGYTPEKIALRRAMSMAYPIQEEIAIIYKNQATEAHSHIAPGMAGYTPERSPTLVQPGQGQGVARHVRLRGPNGDGWREMPDGSPLVIDRPPTRSCASARERALAARHDRHRVRITFDKSRSSRTCASRHSSAGAGSATAGSPTTPRREFPAALPHQVDRRGQLHALQPCGVRRALREVEGDARLARAHGDLPADGAHPLGVQPLAGELHPHALDPGPALGDRVQEAPVRARAVEVPRRRPRKLAK